MQTGRQTQVDQVDVGIGEQLLVVGVLFDLRQIDLAAARTKVALNRSPIAGELLLITGRDCGDAGSLEPCAASKWVYPMNPTPTIPIRTIAR